MDVYKTFLEKYKNVEVEIKNLNFSPDDANMKWLEDNLNMINLDAFQNLNEQQIQTKMRICRNLRNYISHENDYASFIAISDGMMEFLDCLYNIIKAHQTTLKDIITLKNIYVLDTDTFINAISFMEKQKIKELVVLSGKNEEDLKYIGTITNQTIKKAIIKGYFAKKTKISTDIKILEKNVVFAKEDVKLIDLIGNYNDYKILISTSNGKSTGKVNGIAQR